MTWWRRSTPSSISLVWRREVGSPRAGAHLHPSRSGSTITAEIQGVIDACVKLTGMPDLTLSFMVSPPPGAGGGGVQRAALCPLPSTQNPRLLDDVSFHPCVRFKRWEAERILSFIPPDGSFRLLSYHVSSQKSVRYRPAVAAGRVPVGLNGRSVLPSAFSAWWPFLCTSSTTSPSARAAPRAALT